MTTPALLAEARELTTTLADLFLTAIDAGSLTCTEAETVADVFRALGRPDDADGFIGIHAESDQDVEDEHHGMYLEAQARR